MRRIDDMDELRAIELSILVRVGSFCTQEGIPYYLAYGTLLGAIRHGGFIPWDDDIDIWMLRKDYERFLARFPEAAEGLGLAINSRDTTEGYNRVFAKVFDTRTSLVETDRDNPFPEGVFVDVYPVDGLPDNAFLRSIRLAHLQYIKLRLLAIALKNTGRRDGEAAVLFLGRKILSFGSAQRLVRAFDRIAQRSPVDETEYCMFTNAGTMGRNCVSRSKYFDGTVPLAFEDEEFPCPSGYDRLLADRYGDYMKYPPVAMRMPHHEFEAYWKEA